MNRYVMDLWIHMYVLLLQYLHSGQPHFPNFCYANSYILVLCSMLQRFAVKFKRIVMYTVNTNYLCTGYNITICTIFYLSTEKLLGFDFILERDILKNVNYIPRIY